jgi:hypothetical protein
MKQFTLLLLAFVLSSTSFIDFAEAKKRRQSRSQIAYAQAVQQSQAQLEQAQVIPPAPPSVTGCEVFAHFTFRPDVVVSGITSLSITDCNNLNIASGGVPFNPSNAIAELTTYRDFTSDIYLGHYSNIYGVFLGISEKAAYEVLGVGKLLYSHPSVAQQLFFLPAGGITARGVWR